jgi:hypothetical protein
MKIIFFFAFVFAISTNVDNVKINGWCSDKSCSFQHIDSNVIVIPAESLKHSSLVNNIIPGELIIGGDPYETLAYIRKNTFQTLNIKTVEQNEAKNKFNYIKEIYNKMITYEKNKESLSKINPPYITNKEKEEYYNYINEIIKLQFPKSQCDTKDKYYYCCHIETIHEIIKIKSECKWFKLEFNDNEVVFKIALYNFNGGDDYKNFTGAGDNELIDLLMK